MLTSCGPSVRAPRSPVPYGLRRARGLLSRESVPPFGARMSFVSSYGVVREEQLGESTDSRRDLTGLEVRTSTDETTGRFPELEHAGACGPTGLSKGTRGAYPLR